MAASADVCCYQKFKILAIIKKQTHFNVTARNTITNECRNCIQKNQNRKNGRN